MARGPIQAMPDLGDAKGVVTTLLMQDTVRTQHGCLRWRGPTQRVGRRRYPMFTWRGHNTSAARWAWHLMSSPLKAGQQLIRLCEEELCIAPTHHTLKVSGYKAATRPAEATSEGNTSPTAPSPLSVPSRPSPDALLERHLQYQITNHARSRAQELGFTINEVLLAAADPEQSYVSSSARYDSGGYVHQRGDLAVVVNRESKTVITVLLRRKDQWEHGKDQRNGRAVS